MRERSAARRSGYAEWPSAIVFARYEKLELVMNLEDLQEKCRLRRRLGDDANLG